MLLITKEIEKKFEKCPLYSQDGKGLDAQVIVKYFCPTSNHTWYVLEGSKDGDDYEMFAYVSTGNKFMDEYGYVRLSDLKNIKLPFGLGIERDLYTQLGTLGEMLKKEGRLFS